MAIEGDMENLQLPMQMWKMWKLVNEFNRAKSFGTSIWTI